MAAQIDENIQYTDELTGELLNNGYIYFGIDGLDAKINPQTIYADRELTVPLSNPQRIGSDGRALNKIWVSGKYSMKVENYENVQKLNDLSLGEITPIGNTVLGSVTGINAVVADASPTLTALVNGQTYIFTAASTNTGPMTLTIGLTSTYSIKKYHDGDMQAGDIEANQVVSVIWNATDSVFELISASSRSALYPTTKAEAAGLTYTAADAGRVLHITSDDGGKFVVKYNATPGTYADNGGSYCGTQFIPTGGDGTIGLVRDDVTSINVKWFGAAGDGVTDDTSSFSAANTVGGILIPSGTYVLSAITITNPSIFLSGAVISNAVGLVKFNNSVDAGDYQIFSGVGTYEVRDDINVRWFGATGNASTDDQPAIQASIDAVPSVGGIVFFPQGGWWRCNSGLTLASPAITLRGTGIGNSTRLYFSDTNYINISISGVSCELRDLSLGFVARTGASTAIVDTATGGTRVINVKMDGCANGIKTDSAKSVFSDVSIINTTPGSSIGLLMQGSSEVREVRNMFFENAPGNDAFAGIHITGGAGIQISNCDLQKCGKPLNIVPDGTTNVYSVNVDNTFFDTSSSYGVNISPTSTGVVGRTRFSNCWFSSCNTGLYINGKAWGIILSGCEFFDNANDGITVITGSELQGMEVTGCTFAGNGGDGAQIGAGVGDFIFTGNHVGPGAGFGANGKGIVIDAGASDDYIIKGNYIKGNTSSDLTDGGTGINKIVKDNITGTSTSIASAATITLNPSGDYFNITGTTSITSITASWAGRRVALKFAGILTFTDGSNLKLAGNFVTTADDTIALVCDGIDWYEETRSVN